MALATFNPPMRPSPGTGHAPEISLRRASFGDLTDDHPAKVTAVFREDFSQGS